MKQLKFECPECGTEFTLTANQTKAKERIEALKKAGVDVSELFAMQSADGLEFIASKRDGVISILEEDDPIFQAIIIQGTIPNRQLFRRWVMAQMFRIIYITTNTHGAYKPIGVSEVIRNMGYEYQWKMLNNELYAQHKMMQNGDVDNFRDRNRWFNKRVVLDMAKDYIEKLKKRFEKLKLRKCKGVPYKRINGQNIFVDDFDKKVIKPLLFAVHKIQHAENTYELWHSVQEFNKRRIKMHWGTPQNAAWLDAYKGAGAFFTMQNMIRFHNCVIIDDNGKTLSKNASLAFLNKKAKLYENREGWRLIGMLKKTLDDNNIEQQIYSPPIILVNLDGGPMDVVVHKVWLNNNSIKLSVYDNGWGNKINIELDDISPGHLSYIIEYMPVTDKVKSVAINDD